ncbi:MAG: MerR family transcriptional regulator [Alphaproteobacteria bacterium]|nr:MerR family transcriptional regulator [Alphaproteobacteria bacterium]
MTTELPFPPAAGADRGDKAASAFRTISEVAEDLSVPQHVLRFWETKFTQVRPLKRGGGRRYYRPEDVEMLRRVKALLYSEGYTIKGVQKLLRQGASRQRPAAAAPRNTAPSIDPDVRARLVGVMDQLAAIRRALDDHA